MRGVCRVGGSSCCCGPSARSVVGASWGEVGPARGQLRGYVGPSSRYVGPSWGYLVAMSPHLEAIWGLCWASLRPFWGLCWAMLTHVDPQDRKNGKATKHSKLWGAVPSGEGRRQGGQRRLPTKRRELPCGNATATGAWGPLAGLPYYNIIYYIVHSCIQGFEYGMGASCLTAFPRQGADVLVVQGAWRWRRCRRNGDPKRWWKVNPEECCFSHSLDGRKSLRP